MDNIGQTTNGNRSESPIANCICRLDGIAKESESVIKGLFGKLAPILSQEASTPEEKEKAIPCSELENKLSEIGNRAGQNLKSLYNIKERLQI